MLVNGLVGLFLLTIGTHGWIGVFFIMSGWVGYCIC